MSTSSSYGDNHNAKANAAKAGATNRPTPAAVSAAGSSSVPPADVIDRSEADPVVFQRNAVRVEQLDPKRVAARRERAAKYL